MENILLCNSLRAEILQDIGKYIKVFAPNRRENT